MEDKPCEFLVVGGPLHPRFSSSEKIKFMGHLSDQSLLQVYRESNIGLLPFFGISNQQGPKLKLLDYMAAKLLVISSPEGVEGYTGLIPWKHYVPARNPKEMAHILSDIPLNTRRFVGIARNGHRFVLSRYRWSTLMQRYMAFMENLREKDGSSVVNQHYRTD
jgi:glycosyltransferase involved in cell wall biosynthesis